jgi:hypothetical protein
LETVASTLVEPVDWALTAYHCATGNCSALALLGLLPFIPSSAGRHADEFITVMYHSANPDAAHIL